MKLKKMVNYLYEATFASIQDNQQSYIPTGCTSFVRDGKLYRNLDWYYSNLATFVVRFKDIKGIAFMNGLEEGQEFSDELLESLPYHMCDGTNKYGIKITTHVLYNDWQYDGDGDKSIPIYQIPFILLNELSDIDEISNVMGNYLANISIPQTLRDSEYLLQFLVTDGTTTYAILPPESSSGSYVVQNITSNPKLANFRWVNRSTVARSDNDIQTRPTGIERFNLVGSTTTLEDLRFTLAYESPSRLSEFIGERYTTKDSSDAELEEIYEIAHGMYLERERGDGTWQSMHSIVYSNNDIEHLWVQEDYSHDYANSLWQENMKFVHLPSKEAFNQLQENGYYSDGVNVIYYNPEKHNYIIPKENQQKATIYDLNDIWGPRFSSNFADNTWQQIADACRYNIIPSTWNLGDTKSLTLTNGETYTIRICDLGERYDYSDGSGKTRMVLEFVEVTTDTFQINTQRFQITGGWDASYMRNTNMPLIYSTFPEDLKAVLKDVKIPTMNGGSSTSTLVYSNDKIFLPSQGELMPSGSMTWGHYKAAQAELDATSWYGLYQANNTAAFRIKKNLSGTEKNWWTRSIPSNEGSYFDAILNGDLSRDSPMVKLPISIFFAF